MSGVLAETPIVWLFLAATTAMIAAYGAARAFDQGNLLHAWVYSALTAVDLAAAVVLAWKVGDRL